MVQVRLFHYSQEGKGTKRVFYEAPVEMPILAVTELSKEDEFGSEVKDVVITDNLTGRRIQFVKRNKAYLMRMYFGASMLDLARQDP